MQPKYPLLYFFTALISTTLQFQACQQNNQKNTPEQENSKIKNLDLNKMVDDLKASMISYKQTAQPIYTMDDINSCEIILNRYLTDIHASKTKETGMKIVKNTILALNRLNSKTNEILIETMERDQIAEIIIVASSIKGYNTIDDDITEKWREW